MLVVNSCHAFVKRFLKMKQLLFIIGLINVLIVNASNTSHVITHNKESVVTNPAKGKNEYLRRADFPS